VAPIYVDPGINIRCEAKQSGGRGRRIASPAARNDRSRHDAKAAEKLLAERGPSIHDGAKL
jgi:hypothetical protein